MRGGDGGRDGDGARESKNGEGKEVRARLERRTNWVAVFRSCDSR